MEENWFSHKIEAYHKIQDCSFPFSGLKSNYDMIQVGFYFCYDQIDRLQI